MRTVYALSLLLLICTAWMLLVNTQIIRNVGDMARFGTILFQILAPKSDHVAKARLSNSELVLGKLLSSLLNNGVMLMTGLPIFMLIVLFGGTSFQQVAWTFAVTFPLKQSPVQPAPSKQSLPPAAHQSLKRGQHRSLRF